MYLLSKFFLNLQRTGTYIFSGPGGGGGGIDEEGRVGFTHFEPSDQITV